MAQAAIIALVPARSGAKRVVDKNIRPLGEHPLMAYTIAAAIGSGVFTDVVVSTDSASYADIARHYGADVPFLRPEELSGDTSPDIEWVQHTLARLSADGRDYDCFSILRPTSPFRLAETIRRAWKSFLAEEGLDSLRAVEKCGQHPGKMWIVEAHRMRPLLPETLRLQTRGGGSIEQPWHSCQYQSLPEVYVQNASLEIAWTRVAFEHGNISGDAVLPFFTEGLEGFDVNRAEEWERAAWLVMNGEAVLPPVTATPWDGDAV